MTVPTPLTVAAREEDKKARSSIPALENALRASFGRAAWLAEQAGSDIRAELSSWIDSIGSDAVADWVSAGTTGSQIALRWKESTGRQSHSLLANLIEEEQLSARASQIGTYLRGYGLSLQDSLILVRERIAHSALDSAFRASWTRRTVFARALRLARTYLDFLLEAANFEGVEPRRSLISRYGISAILSARFAPVSQEDLTKACAALLSAHDRGSNNALTYFIEGCTWRYDLFGDERALQEASQSIRSAPGTNVKTISWYLNCAEVWTKLLGTTRRKDVRQELLRRADASVQDAKALGSMTSEEAARLTMLSALIEEFRKLVAEGATDLVARGVNLPFGLRSSHVDMPDTFRRAAPAIAAALGADPRASEYVFRDVLAEVRSYLAHSGELSASESLWNLRKAIALRRGSKGNPRLRGFRIELALAEDQLRLAEITGEVSARREALEFLSSPDDEDSAEAAKLTILAHDLETNGPLVGPLLRGDEDLSIAVRNGDFYSIYRDAASRAVRSPNVTRIELGGRGGVVALRDSDSTLGQTFVFKAMSEAAFARDSARTSEVATLIEDHSLGSRFGVIEHVQTLRGAIPGIDSEPVDSVISIRRFRRGSTLREHLQLGSSSIDAALISTVDFLAFMHARIAQHPERSSPHKVLWEREVGRWLRAVGLDEHRRSAFEQWWRIVEKLPLVPRRDSHAMNWIVAADGKILAVDLDACGMRPLGYELAQLIEDSPLFSPTDWVSRMTLAEQYRRSLNNFKTTSLVSQSDMFTAYQASMLARILWILSSPDLSPETRLSAGQTLSFLSRDGINTDIRNLATMLSHYWSLKTGVAADAQVDRLSEPNRRRISRAMAYHLRHDPLVPATKDGWVHVDELTEIMQVNGHRVTVEQVLLTAGALGEPRFELEGPEIRASYGHSRRTAITYESRRAPKYLYHATPMENLASIVEARAGLVRGRRLWVHLTDSASVAERTSRRHKKPIVVLRIKTDVIDGLVYASGHTWLAKQVDANAIEILPLDLVRKLLDTERQPSADITAEASSQRAH